VRVALQPPKMVKSTLHTRTIFSTDASVRPNCPPVTPDPSTRSEVPFPGRSVSAIETFDIESLDLVRKFVEHVVAKNASVEVGNGRAYRRAINWAAVEASVADSSSFEQAIGRAVVIADQMCRGVFDDPHPDIASSSLKTEDLFFGFSLADVVPDFGDESRYRTRVARRVARIFGIRRTVVTLAVSLALVCAPSPVIRSRNKVPPHRLPSGRWRSRC